MNLPLAFLTISLVLSWASPFPSALAWTIASLSLTAFSGLFRMGVYAVFERLRAIRSIIANVAYMFYDALREAGFSSDTLRNIKVEDEVAQGMVDRIARSYDYVQIFDVINHYLETSDRAIPQVIRELKKIIDRYGGMRALEEFEWIFQTFLDDDELAHYSYSYHSLSQSEGVGRFMALTEEFASFDDYISTVLDMMEFDSAFREMVLSKYGNDFSKWLNRELYSKVAKE
jgi:hypothetical protein